MEASGELIALATATVTSIGVIGAACAKWLSGVFKTFQKDNAAMATAMAKAADDRASTAAADAKKAREDFISLAHSMEKSHEDTHAETMRALREIEKSCADGRDQDRRMILKMAGITETGSFKATRPTPGPGPKKRPSSDHGRTRHDDDVADDVEDEEGEHVA